jgi:hypothetical protein
MSAERTLHHNQNPRDWFYGGVGSKRCGAHRREAVLGNIGLLQGERVGIRELFNRRVVDAVRSVVAEKKGRESVPAEGPDGRYILAIEDPTLRHHAAESLVLDALEHHGWLPAMQDMAYELKSGGLPASKKTRKHPEDARAVCRLQVLEMVEGAMKDIPAIEDRDGRQKAAMAIVAKALPCPGWLGVLEKICGEMEAIGPFQAMLGREIREFAVRVSASLPKMGETIMFNAEQTWCSRHCKGND